MVASSASDHLASNEEPHFCLHFLFTLYSLFLNFFLFTFSRQLSLYLATKPPQLYHLSHSYTASHYHQFLISPTDRTPYPPFDVQHRTLHSSLLPSSLRGSHSNSRLPTNMARHQMSQGTLLSDWHIPPRALHRNLLALSSCPRWSYTRAKRGQEAWY